jgi:hypothetical protein
MGNLMNNPMANQQQQKLINIGPPSQMNRKLISSPKSHKAKRPSTAKPIQPRNQGNSFASKSNYNASGSQERYNDSPKQVSAAKVLDNSQPIFYKKPKMTEFNDNRYMKKITPQ